MWNYTLASTLPKIPSLEWKPFCKKVAPLVVRAVRESIFYETSADPIRFSLLGLDLITRQPAALGPSPSPLEEKDDKASENERMAGQDRWFFTFLLCKLLSG